MNVDKKLNWGLTGFKLLGVQFSVTLADIPKLNYNIIINDLPTRLNFWSNRYTTPFGRINILKTLILPKFIHLFTVLPKPPSSDIKRINSMFYNFIWNNKPDKIKRFVINKSYKQGGLQMIDLEIFIDSLQLTWVKRYFDDNGSQWSILAETNLGGKKRFFEMGSLWHRKHKETVTNPFYQDLLSNWQQFQEAVSPRNIMTMPLWYNPCIAKSGIFLKNLYTSGCVYIADLYSGTGEILSRNDLTDLYHQQCNFLDYHRLKTGLAKYLRSQNFRGPVIKPIQPAILAILNQKMKGTKVFYNLLLERSTEYTYSDLQKKWLKVTPQKFSRDEWRKIFNICFKAIQDNNIVWLQYRIIYRILGTRSLLFKMSITDTSLCRNCMQTEETIEHLFFECWKVKDLLTKFENWLKVSTGIRHSFTKEEILLGIIEKTNYFEALNILLLLLKSYIFEVSRTGSAFNILAFGRKVNNTYIEQEYVANTCSNYKNFEKKWFLIRNLIQTPCVNVNIN